MSCFRVALMGHVGFHGAHCDTERSYRMLNVTDQDPNRSGTYYNDGEVAHLLGISLGRLPTKLCIVAMNWA